MSELFDNDEDKVLVAEDEVIESLDEVTEAEDLDSQHPNSAARRRLENLLDEKRLRNELEDFLDY